MSEIFAVALHNMYVVHSAHLSQFYLDHVQWSLILKFNRSTREEKYLFNPMKQNFHPSNMWNVLECQQHSLESFVIWLIVQLLQAK